MNGTRCAGERGRTTLRWLLPVIMLAAAGCASIPSYKMHSELPQKKGAIRTVGLLAPEIRMYEEQPRFGVNETVPHAEWAPAAEDSVAEAFSAEMAALGVKVVAIPADDPELREMAELFSAVAFSMQRHAWDRPTQTMPPTEVFPEQEKALDYSVGPLWATLEKHQVDAVWMVRGFNLLPTHGARVKDGLEVTIGILAALGGAAAPAMTLKKVGLSAALIDRDGRILYYGMSDDRAEAPDGETGLEDVAKDLRDRRAARYYLKAALAGHRAEAAP